MVQYELGVIVSKLVVVGACEAKFKTWNYLRRCLSDRESAHPKR